MVWPSPPLSTGWVMIVTWRQWAPGMLRSNWVLKSSKNTAEPLVECYQSVQLQFAAETTGAARAPVGIHAFLGAGPRAALNLSEHMGVYVDVFGELIRKVIKTIHHIFVFEGHAAMARISQLMDGGEMLDLIVSPAEVILVNCHGQIFSPVLLLPAVQLGNRTATMGLGK